MDRSTAPVPPSPAFLRVPFPPPSHFHLCCAFSRTSPSSASVFLQGAFFLFQAGLGCAPRYELRPGAVSAARSDASGTGAHRKPPGWRRACATWFGQEPPLPMKLLTPLVLGGGVSLAGSRPCLAVTLGAGISQASPLTGRKLVDAGHAAGPSTSVAK